MSDSGTGDRLNAVRRAVRSQRARLDPLAAADRPDATFESTWRRQFKRRVLVLVLALAGWTVGIEARLVQLQIFQHHELLEDADRQHSHEVPVAAKRGDIVDRDGRILAMSVDADSLFANPRVVKDPEGTVAAICGALGTCDDADRAQMRDRLDSKKAFVYLQRFLSPAEAARVRDLKQPGLGFRVENHRYYPKVDLAAHLLGFVSDDNVGLAGVESAFDSAIRGKDGLELVEEDARQHKIDTRLEVPATAGATVELTIDQYLQYIAERELTAGVEAHHARGGTAVVMDPHTGEVLALANVPTFNPNAFKASSDDERRDRAIQDIYEPGSTFKIVTASAALQEGVVKLDEPIDTNPGYITIPGRSKPVHDAEGHDYGVIPFEDVIVKSSNVGAIKVGLRVGADRMGAYARRFGFGQILSPDLKGESRGILWSPGAMDESALASMSMGYQVGVTPMQMATAVSAVANGGTLYEPHVVRAIVRDGERAEVAPRALRDPITPETAATLTTIMEEVVRRGTGTEAQMAGYQVAGKTGTAAKIENGTYSETDYNASFVGFVPSRHPALTIVVVVDSPRGEYFGGLVAAPIFKRIAEAALRQMGVPPSSDAGPPVVFAERASLDAPPAPPPSLIPVVLAPGGAELVPDVRGLGGREAVRVLGAAGLSVRLDGSGVVVEQSPAAGSPLVRGGWGVLQLGRSVPTDAHSTDRPAAHVSSAGSGGAPR